MSWNSESLSDDVRRSLPHKERISLRLWAFRFINYEDAESFGVTVEGYRANDQTETILRNWHSTAIEERISSSLLRSRTGTIYELRGPIDKDLAYLYGYPAHLVSAFAYGFPGNWKHLLKKFFDTVKTTIPLSTSLNFSTFDRLRSLDALGGANQTSRLSARSSAVGTSVTLPDVITEELEDEEVENTSSEDAVLLPVVKSNETTNFERQDALSKNILDSCVASMSEPMQHSADSARSSNESISRCAKDPIPTVQSPTSVSSQSVNEDLSAGPLYHEPNSSADLSKHKDVRRESNLAGSSRNALLPRLQNVADIATSQCSKSTNNDVVELSQWSLRFAPIEFGDFGLGFPAFVVLGHKEGHFSPWQTSIVTRVVSADIFYTKSTKYRLIGDINVIDSANAGFPKTFVAKFSRGFPPDWRTTITQLYDSFFSHLKRTGMLESRPEGGGHADLSHTADFGNKTQLHFYESAPYSPRKSGSSKQSRMNDISYRNFLKPTEADVRSSRSGRCVRPPLAEWAGQRIRYDGRGNVIGIQDVTNIAKGALDISDLCNYYGVSPSNESTRKRPESVMEVARFSGGQCSKRPPRRGPFRKCNISTDCADNSSCRKFMSSSGDRSGMLSRARNVVEDVSNESDDSSYERELRMERKLIRDKEKELQKQQEELLDWKRRIALEEKNRRRNRTAGKCSVPQVRNRWFSHSEEVSGGRNRNRTKGKPNQRKRGKNLSYNMDDCDENYREDRDEQRRYFEEIWARENEELRTDSDYDKEEWGKPVRKMKKVPAKRAKTRVLSSVVSSNEGSVGDEENYSVDGGKASCSKLSVRKERGWNKAELQRLKLALAAIYVRNEDDWEKVSRSLGSERNPESCKQAAIKRLKWKPTNPSNSPTPQITSDFVTARAGTIAHHYQTNEYTRKFMMGGGGQGEDYFHHNTTMMSNSIPDVTDFGADDSLLEAIQTPEEGVNKRKGNNRRQFFAEPVEDDTPPRRHSSGLHVETPTDSTQRERQARYCHYVLNKGGRGRGKPRMNFSRVGDSTCFERTRDEELSRNGQTFGDLHENLEKAAKITQKAARRRNDMDDSNSDMDDSDLDDPAESSF